jgi:exodeoxyribonuclease VII large subunit
MVGLGELLARLERRRQLLAAEGLFARERKRPLPFLPHRIGLVTARGSAAERDVLENARRRWPAVAVETRYAAMQGPSCARDVMEAVQKLDAAADVDVIVVARGGGSIEDLLPFSDEGLVRVVAKARTPVVSAIGHEQDTPLLDLVADVRASTPTDAAKLLVPDVREELERVDELRRRARRHVTTFVAHELAQLAQLRARPVLAAPVTVLDQRAGEVRDLVSRARRSLLHRLDRADDDLDHARARVRALSPLETLRRGYAVVQDAHGHVLTSVTQTATGEHVTARLSSGHLALTVDGLRADPDNPDAPDDPAADPDPEDVP